MRLCIGNSNKEITSVEFEGIIRSYQSVVIDIGTGEGEFVYKKAKQDKEVMFIGIDASADAMREYSKKSGKKPLKGGADNVLYVVASAQNLPDALAGKADRIYINLPWGTLRDGIVKGEDCFLNNIRKIARDNATLEICISYCELYEKKVVEGRELPKITLSYLRGELKTIYNKYGINITKVSVLTNEDIKNLETKWAKKLGYGRKRDVFYMKCRIKV